MKMDDASSFTFDNKTLRNDTEIYISGVDKFLLSLYIIVTLVGIFSNGLVLYAYATKLVKRTPFLMLLLNLSVSDIMIDLSVYPYLFVDPSRYHDASGAVQSFVCAVAAKQTLGWIAVIANVTTLIYISFVRLTSFNSGGSGINTILKERNVKIVICCSWLLGGALFMHQFFLFSISATTHICEHTSNKYFVTANGLIDIWVLLVNFNRYFIIQLY